MCLSYTSLIVFPKLPTKFLPTTSVLLFPLLTLLLIDYYRLQELICQLCVIAEKLN